MPRGLSRSFKKDLLASQRGRERIYKKGCTVKALRKGGKEQEDLPLNALGKVEYFPWFFLTVALKRSQGTTPLYFLPQEGRGEARERGQR